MDSFFLFPSFFGKNGRMAWVGRWADRQLHLKYTPSWLTQFPPNLCRATFEPDAAPSSLLPLPPPPATSRRLPPSSPSRLTSFATRSLEHLSPPPLPVTKQNFQTIRHFPISSLPLSLVFDELYESIHWYQSIPIPNPWSVVKSCKSRRGEEGRFLIRE